MDNKRWREDLERCRKEAEKGGLKWPGWTWSDGTELVGETVMLQGELVLVQEKTAGGFYGSAITYRPDAENSTLKDEKGYWHSYGVIVPKKYEPENDHYYEDKKEEPVHELKYVQLSLF